jgi:hypothetical protein
MLHETLENCRRGLLSKISKAMILLAILVSIQDIVNIRFFGHLATYNLPNDLDLKNLGNGMLMFMKTPMQFFTFNLELSQLYTTRKWWWK